ncbi:hypothetical protein A2W32_04680 [candidate division WWE3 bacterium RBG_16_37_10]|uniref:Uncharacterized protein n=1 Tax=candidate division WWE3 bacterium RBG_16_37_10 TaxID=1802610 RepID=A0A1F4UT60_UNCKA|nr:MAG: hypothetical protein A2W32_04680 [candidate division WWE3 bacterium RBG_16_37_10]
MHAFPKMEVATVEATQRNLVAMGYNRIRLVFHGGEPLLRGLPFYQQVVEMQARLRQEFPDVMVENGIQSNLKRLTPEWCEFFKQHRFSVGTSLDGWRELHNYYRQYPDGSGTFDDVMRGLEMAKEYGILGGYIAVITDQTLKQDPKAYFDYLVSINPKVELSPCWEMGSPDNKPPYVLEPRDFLNFLKATFDVWLARDDPKLEVRLLHGFMQALLGGRDMTCSFKGNCRDFLAIEADGSVYPCGKFAGIPEFYLGNINTQPLAEVLANPIYATWLANRTDMPPKCQACPWVKTCFNGCTYERYMGNGQFAEVSPLCDVWTGMFEYTDQRIKELQAQMV